MVKVMTTLLTTRPTKNELNHLKEEITILRSFIIGLIGKDEEGNYRPEFVRRVLKVAKQKPIREFQNARSFLKDLQSFNVS
jgi:hypothetical protein